MPDPSFPWGPFLMLALVNCITPGPNVVLLTGSGSAWGYVKSLPHLAGICVGFPLMLLVVQFGAAEAFQRLPWLFPVLTVVSLGYVFWLSLRIFRMAYQGEIKVSGSRRPMSFLEAVLFQWVNGKAWQAMIMIATLYPTHSVRIRLLGALSYVGILFFCGSLWLEVGKRITRYLENPLLRKVYYTSLALALLLSTFPTGISQLLSSPP